MVSFADRPARDTIRERVKAFQETCKRRGLKVTHQRMEIYRELTSTGEHPDAETIYRRVRKRIPTISLDTVYRNLKLLAEEGLISVVGTGQERLRFDGNVEPHHHFLCVKCGMIGDFCSDLISDLTVPREAEAFGEPLSQHLEVKGVCKTCKARAR